MKCFEMSVPEFRMISWWGWVVVALSSVQYALVLGPVYNYSIVLLSFQEEFHTSTSFTGEFLTFIFWRKGFWGVVSRPTVLSP